MAALWNGTEVVEQGTDLSHLFWMLHFCMEQPMPKGQIAQVQINSPGTLQWENLIC